MSMGEFVDEAFIGAGQTVGLEIWRIEKLKPVPVDRSTYGNFYTGDSYICMKTRKRGNALEWDIHFWLGAETSQDEAGVAAYKTVELDDSLGGGPIQYREVQKHESKRFLDLFPDGIRYLDGGVESGFTKVDRDAYAKKLFIIKGKRNIRIEQVELSYESLNQGDVFVLDDGKTIYCWNGSESTKRERVRAAEVARKIKDEERGGKAKVILIDAGNDNDTEFFAALGSKGPIKSAADGGDDDEYEKKAVEDIALYRVSDSMGELKIEKSNSPPLKKEHLDTNDCFILDAGKSGVFSWIGKKCTKEEKKAAMDNALKFIADKGYPNYTQVSRVIEGGEPPLFISYFSSWVDENASLSVDFSAGAITNANANVAKYSTEKFDLSTLHVRKAVVKKENLPDDGSGTVKIWKIENFEEVEVAEKDFGIFYEGDCYVILYTYRPRNTDKYILYYWLGLKSTADEKGSAAIVAQKIDEDHGGTPVQVRVVQGKEPEHFLRIFHGKMLIMRGGVESGFNRRSKLYDASSFDQGWKAIVQLFQIRGTNAFNTRAVEVLARGASLNSNDVFILKSEDECFKWEGSGASAEEKEYAEGIASQLAPSQDLTTVAEGEEPDSFWRMLNGKEEYASMARLAEVAPEYAPRLFQCSNAIGRFTVEEIHAFDQDDLCEDDVMLLDTYDEIFVWIGRGANAVEKKNALHGALEYLETDSTGRTTENTGVLQVKQGFEPLNFTGYFMGWDAEKWSKGLSYDDLKREMGGESVGVTCLTKELEKYEKTYPYEMLIDRGIELDGVDPCHKENHLSDQDFMKYFECTKEEFKKMKKWKQDGLKKKLKLF